MSEVSWQSWISSSTTRIFLFMVEEAGRTGVGP